MAEARQYRRTQNEKCRQNRRTREAKALIHATAPTAWHRTLTADECWEKVARKQDKKNAHTTLVLQVRNLFRLMTPGRGFGPKSRRIRGRRNF